MPEKCSVVGCKSGYVNGPTSTRFRFPPSFHELRVKWILFLNRPDYEITANSRICADHFEAQYVKVNETRNRLVPFNQNPIPTIHPLSVPNSQAVVPTQQRKPPKVRIFQLDEIHSYVEKYTIRHFDDVARFLKKSPEYQDFTFHSTEDSITAYHLVIDAGIARIKECISINKAFRVTLSFEGSPVPLPEYIARATGSKLTHLYLLENLPNYCSWLAKWENSTKFGLSRQTFSALRQTNRVIAELSSDLLSEGYKFVLTGRMQTDCLERRFSNYRQMSGGRFLVSLSEVISSESILKMKSLLEHKLEISALAIESTQEYDDNLLEEQVLKLQCINYEDLVLSEKSHNVVAYISGYISHKLLKDVSCLDCVNSLQQDPIQTQYLQDLDRGGLTLPSSSLNNFVESAFCVLEASETEIVQTEFPWKILSLRLLQEVSQSWDTAFACIIHTPQARKTVNRIIANIYYNNLRKSINEGIRKDQVAAFKSAKRQKVT